MLRPRSRPALAALLALAAGAALAAAPDQGLTARDLEADRRFVAASAALGWEGPLGPWGPLGELGPIGSNAWNPSRVMARLGGWSRLAGVLTTTGGPLSEDGPLGPGGPLAPAALAGLRSHPTLRELEPEGALSVLGPTGPLGALGPLGPLGPMGAHGFAPDPDGRYLASDGARMSEVPVPGRGDPLELVEHLREASAPETLDTSFLLEGSVSPEAPDGFRLRSSQDQLVTVLVLPLRSHRPFMGGLPDLPVAGFTRPLFDVDLEVVRGGAGPDRVSDSSELVDWIRFRALAGQTFEVRVRAKDRGGRRPYRLVVVGSAGFERGGRP